MHTLACACSQDPRIIMIVRCFKWLHRSRRRRTCTRTSPKSASPMATNTQRRTPWARVAATGGSDGVPERWGEGPPAEGRRWASAAHGSRLAVGINAWRCRALRAMWGTSARRLRHAACARRGVLGGTGLVRAASGGRGRVNGPGEDHGGGARATATCDRGGRTRSGAWHGRRMSARDLHLHLVASRGCHCKGLGRPRVPGV